ncbi:MAG: hypothetical protein HY392_04385 [Candidatus Diapherotrites archaeon]|nr:hypothetical protein [Candidatus Diapherotrites archaeon]
MAVLVCDECSSKVESNRCCGEPMSVQGNKLVCMNCEKEVEVNYCHGKHMHEKK